MEIRVARLAEVSLDVERTVVGRDGFGQPVGEVRNSFTADTVQALARKVADVAFPPHTLERNSAP